MPQPQPTQADECRDFPAVVGFFNLPKSKQTCTMNNSSSFRSDRCRASDDGFVHDSFLAKARDCDCRINFPGFEDDY